MDIAAITETWFTTQHNNITAELWSKGYSIYHFNRSTRKGGGVALIFRNDFKFIQGKTFNFDTFECILVSIGCTSARHLNFLVVYRYGEIAPSYFLTEFYKFVDNIFISLKNFIILGDFNLHVNEKFNPSTVRFYDILSSFSLNQIIDGPTHKMGNTLDLVIHNLCDTIIKDLHIDFNSKSDHAYIFFKLLQDIELNSKKTVTVNSFNNVNFEHFKNDISDKVENYISIADGDFSDALSVFNNLCNVCVEGHVESRRVVINSNPRPKWIDTEFLKARSERRRLYKRWKRTRNPTDRINFVNARLNAHNISIGKRSKFYATRIDNCQNSHKELFKVCKNLLDQSKQSKLPTYSSPVSMATKFNDYFLEKIENIRSSFPSKTCDVTGSGMNTYNGTIMSKFKVVSQEQIKKTILSKPIKTSPQDPLPAPLLRASVDVLLPALEHLVNLSLAVGSMDGLKDTVITPLLKKAGLDPEVLKNYRPVCNILYLSKLIEREVLVQCNEHMELNNEHTPNQSGYKAKHSCETLLMRVTNDIFMNFDNSYCVIMLLLDLSAAFDTVDHAVLLDILWYELGFRGNVYMWFVEFLRDRRQAVNIDGHNSSFKENIYGVPQGSVIGPFLFNIYVRSLIKQMEKAGFTIHGYADDHQILFSFKIDFQVAVIRRTIPQCLDLISNWMNKHFLKLNPSKSQVIVFYPKAISGQIVFNRLMLSDGSFIEISQEVYNLGVTLDSQLTYSPYISSIISQGYQLIRSVAGIRKYLSTDHLKTLVNSIVIAKVDNCNSLLYGISAYDTGRLQKFQNSCARLIYRKQKYDHVTGILKELHWLPSEARTYFKILCYVYKCIHSLAPSYLADLIVIKRDHNLSLIVPRCNSRSGDRAFSCAGPRLWNALPVDLRMINTLDKFKSQLKHLLFSSFHKYKFQVNVYRS